MSFIKASKPSETTSFSTNNGSFIRRQAKLSVGKSDDPLEKEADHTADKVVQNSLLSNASPNVPFIQPAAQIHQAETIKDASSENEEVEIQEKPIAESITQLKLADDDETKSVQKKCKDCGSVANSGEDKCPECQKKGNIQLKPNGGSGTSNVEQSLSSSKGGGRSMEPNTLSEMNAGFGADFSNVNIHTDANAVQMSQDLGAQAFTHGNDIYFNEGKYTPSSNEGKHLLAHELTHTVQQGASGNPIQKKEIVIQRKTADEAADVIEDALQGYSSRWDSENILAEFTVHRDNKGRLESILRAVKARGSNNGLSGNGMIDWLFEDMTAEDGRTLRDLLIRARVSEVNRLVAELTYSYLSGYTSASNSGSILGILVPYVEAQLDDVLSKLESFAEMSETDTREWLFSDLTSVHSEQLRVHFLTSGGVKAQNNYGAKQTAYKIYNLLSGYTSVSDSWSVVSNFERTPSDTRDLVLHELNVLTGTDWGERKGIDALMQDLNKSDYDKLVVLEGIVLPQYDYEQGWLEWGWNGFLSGVDWVSMVIQWGVCGVVGILTGALSVVYDIIVLVKDLGLVIWDLVQSLAYLISGGAVGSEGWLAVKDFFRGLGQLWDAPGEVIERAWDEMVLEGTLIEGPFEACQEAEFWVRKFVNLLVNIILIFLAGYGAVKLGASGVKTIASVIAKSGYRKGIVELGSMVLRGSGKMVAGLGDDAIRVIRGLTSPVETMGKVSTKLNKIQLAADDVGYWQFLRQQAGIAAEGEVTFWRENKQFWDDLAESRRTRLDQIDEQVGTLMDDIEGNNVPANAETTVDEIAESTSQLSDEVDEVLENVRTGTVPISPSQAAQDVADILGMEARVFGSFSESELSELLESLNGFTANLNRDRIGAVKNYITSNLDKSRTPQKIVDQIERLSTKTGKELDEFLTPFGLRPIVERGWRGRTRMEDGNLHEGWEHIDSRHITGNHPEGHGDLFPPGTTRAELEGVAQVIIDKGNRLSPISRRIQTFVDRVKVQGVSMRVKVTVDVSDGRIITIFPNRTGN